MTLAFVRYGLPALIIVGGVVMLVVGTELNALDGFFGMLGVGLSVLLLNWLFRLGVKGDRERDDEEAARRYLDEHGHWPDEAPRG